jgi:hypothetical protein
LSADNRPQCLLQRFQSRQQLVRLVAVDERLERAVLGELGPGTGATDQPGSVLHIGNYGAVEL